MVLRRRGRGWGFLSLSLTLSRTFSLLLCRLRISCLFSWVGSSGAVWVLRAGFLGPGMVGRCQNWGGVYSKVLGGTQAGCAWAFGCHGSFGISSTGPWGIFGLGSGSAALLPSSNDNISNPAFRATSLDTYPGTWLACN